MISIIKEEIEINAQLKKKVIWACSFNNTSPIIKNGSLLKLKPFAITLNNANEQIKMLNDNNKDLDSIRKDNYEL